jgi:hypothetical protein
MWRLPKLHNLLENQHKVQHAVTALIMGDCMISLYALWIGSRMVLDDVVFKRSSTTCTRECLARRSLRFNGMPVKEAAAIHQRQEEELVLDGRGVRE